MRGKGAGAGIASNPVLVGAVTILVVVVAVFLSYNANQGLPFVPTTAAEGARRQRRQPRAGQRGPLGRLPRRRGRGHAAGAAGRRRDGRRDQAQARQADRRHPARLEVPHPPALRARPQVRRAHRGRQRRRLPQRRDRPRRAGQLRDGARRGLQAVRRGDARGLAGEPARVRRLVRRPRDLARPHLRGAAAAVRAPRAGDAQPRRSGDRPRDVLRRAGRRGAHRRAGLAPERRSCSPRWPTRSRRSGATRAR